MEYLRSIEISRVEMAPAEETFGSSASKRTLLTVNGIKLLELCLIICLIGLIDEPATHSHQSLFVTPRVIAVCYVTFGCYVIYTSIYLIMAMFGEMSSWRASTLWTLIAAILFLATTVLLFRDWSNTKDLNYWHPNMARLDLVLAAASVSLVTTLVYLIDLIVTIRLGMRGELE